MQKGQTHLGRWSLVALLVLGLPLSQAAGAELAPRPSKKLIEFGWDEPDTAFMSAHAEELERSPFDGCVFHAEARKAGARSGSFTWESWGTRAFTEADLQPALEELRAVRFHRFTENFLRFNTTPAKLDWFDDYGVVLTNAQVAAWFVKQAKCKAILFDIEQYEGQLFDFRKQKDATEKGWEGYAAKARERGREVMNAFQQGAPDLTIFLTFGYSLPWRESRAGKNALADCHYGLLAPFLDGMVEAAKGRTRLIDGNESSYGYRDTNRFAAAYRGMKDDLLPIVREPAKYRQVFSFSFGLWLDNDWRKLGWNETDFSRNYFSPETFEASVRQALAVADDYVWIYSETPRWWSKEGTPVKLPNAYDAALRRGSQP
jgi:hypothetical protein